MLEILVYSFASEHDLMLDVCPNGNGLAYYMNSGEFIDQSGNCKLVHVFRFPRLCVFSVWRSGL
jgi:hypothetical protein